MCIIAIKPAGKKMQWDVLKTCFENNPDGAGFAYPKDDHVYISKGFMDFKSFRRAVNEANIKKGTMAMFHFRIATHGGVSEANCHPFPLTSDEKVLRALDVKSTFAIAHNGIVPDAERSKTMSDTMMFVRDYLAPLGASVTDPNVQHLIGKAAASKLAIMTATKITTIGSFVESNGWLYSNDSYAKSYAIVTWSIAKTAVKASTNGEGFSLSDGGGMGTSMWEDKYYFDPLDDIWDKHADLTKYDDYPMYCDACGEEIEERIAEEA